MHILFNRFPKFDLPAILLLIVLAFFVMANTRYQESPKQEQSNTAKQQATWVKCGASR